MNYPDRLGSEYYRQFLTAQGRSCYDHICDQLNRGDYSGQTTVSVQDRSKASEDCFAAIKAVRDDHPEYFFLGDHFEFVLRGEQGTVKYPIVYSPRDINRVNVQLEKKIGELTRSTKDLTSYSKEKIIYERIAKGMTYKDEDDGRDHTVVGPILLSSGVCEGQNALLILCLRRVGIPCIKVYGKTDKGTWHCWTIAWIDGRSVHCDVTWDNADKGQVYFDYFNLSDAQMKRDHFEFSDSTIPKCKAENMTYYRHYKLNVKSFSDLCAHIENGYKAGALPILINFDYVPVSNSYFQEIDKAIRACRIREGYCARSKAKKENIAIQFDI